MPSIVEVEVFVNVEKSGQNKIRELCENSLMYLKELHLIK
jgi:hypothetical protein